MSDDRAFSTVFGAVLVFGIITIALATVTFNWAPVWVEREEGQHSDELRRSVHVWGDLIEDRVQRGVAEEPFAHTFPVGNHGSLMLPGSDTTGSAAVTSSPTLLVLIGGSPVASENGALAVGAGYTRFQPQSFRYVFGAIELEQAGATWVDLRAFFAASRGIGGTIDLSMRPIGVTGPERTSTSTDNLQVVSYLSEVSVASQPAGNVRVVIEGVKGDAWRASLERSLQDNALSGARLADCSASTTHYCLDADTNDADTVDIELRNVAASWTLQRGTATVLVGR